MDNEKLTLLFLTISWFLANLQYRLPRKNHKPLSFFPAPFLCDAQQESTRKK